MSGPPYCSSRQNHSGAGYPPQDYQEPHPAIYGAEQTYMYACGSPHGHVEHANLYAGDHPYTLEPALMSQDAPEPYLVSEPSGTRTGTRAPFPFPRTSRTGARHFVTPARATPGFRCPFQDDSGHPCTAEPFNLPSEIRAHILDTHMRFSPFQCRNCKRVFTRLSLETRHLRQDTNAEGNQRHCPNSPVADDRNYQIRCEVRDALWDIHTTQDEVDRAVSLIMHYNGHLEERRRRAPASSTASPQPQQGTSSAAARNLRRTVRSLRRSIYRTATRRSVNTSIGGHDPRLLPPPQMHGALSYVPSQVHPDYDGYAGAAWTAYSGDPVGYGLPVTTSGPPQESMYPSRDQYSGTSQKGHYR